VYAQLNTRTPYLVSPQPGTDDSGEAPFWELLVMAWPLLAENSFGGSMDTTWMAEGKCRELPPEVFFPSDGVGVELARRVCADCPVKAPCLEYALYNRIEHGVWGGASERERRRIARRRRGAQTAHQD
jgi:WhiB family redox-sensing transcriptional regulator